MRRYLVATCATIALTALAFWKWPVLTREVMARNCLGNMKSIGYEATVWSCDHHDAAPTNWVCFSAELITPKMMLCPADSSRTSVTEWTRFGPENSSYEMVDGGGRSDN